MSEIERNKQCKVGPLYDSDSFREGLNFEVALEQRHNLFKRGFLNLIF
jgi:hypothetical protein